MPKSSMEQLYQSMGTAEKISTGKTGTAIYAPAIGSVDGVIT